MSKLDKQKKYLLDMECVEPIERPEGWVTVRTERKESEIVSFPNYLNIAPDEEWTKIISKKEVFHNRYVIKLVGENTSDPDRWISPLFFPVIISYGGRSNYYKNGNFKGEKEILNRYGILWDLTEERVSVNEIFQINKARMKFRIKEDLGSKVDLIGDPISKWLNLGGIAVLEISFKCKTHRDIPTVCKMYYAYNHCRHFELIISYREDLEDKYSELNEIIKTFSWKEPIYINGEGNYTTEKIDKFYFKENQDVFREY